jgi:hypothetical protein
MTSNTEFAESTCFEAALLSEREGSCQSLTASDGVIKQRPSLASPAALKV